MKIADFISRHMALGVLLGAVVALSFPTPVSACFKTAYIPWFLGAVMFGMGLTLRGRDFALVLSRPRDVLLGVAAQFLLMPGLAWLLAKALGLPDEIALGVILVGTCPGGTASNVISYLARGDVALSVTMTSCSTLLAPVLTPLLTLALAGHSVDVDAAAMLLSIAKVVLAPVAAGVLANEFLGGFARRVRGAMPAFSTIAIIVIVMAVMSASAERILENLGLILVAVVLHNLLGYAGGYATGRLFGMDPARRRTLAIEVGMQNSGLAVSLAHTHFAAYPLAAVPGALFSVWHNLSGPLFAGLCRILDERNAKKD